MWYVYILECADGSLYTGLTNDLIKRVETHNKGKGAKYTRGRRPVILLTSFSVETKSIALKEECRIKKLNRADKLLLINELS